MKEGCIICGKKEPLQHIHLDGYIEEAGKKTFLNNSIYVCDECLSLCEKCHFCGKLKASQLIEIYITSDKYSWQNNFFCHCVETENQKKERYKREEMRYAIFQSKKRSEKLKLFLKEKGVI